MLKNLKIQKKEKFCCDLYTSLFDLLGWWWFSVRSGSSTLLLLHFAGFGWRRLVWAYGWLWTREILLFQLWRGAAGWVLKEWVFICWIWGLVLVSDDRSVCFLVLQIDVLLWILGDLLQSDDGRIQKISLFFWILWSEVCLVSSEDVALMSRADDLNVMCAQSLDRFRQLLMTLRVCSLPVASSSHTISDQGCSLAHPCWLVIRASLRLLVLHE